MSSVPITAHEHRSSATNGPRRSSRYRIGPLVYIDLGPSNGGFPINVSEDGLGFQGIQPLQREQLLTIRFKLPDLENPVETSGQIIWVNQIGTGGGLRFVDLSEDSRLLIKKWISSENQSGRVENDIDAATAGSVENSLEKTKVESSFQAAMRDALPIPTELMPSAKDKSAADSVRQIPTVAVQSSALFPVAQTEPRVNIASMPRPLRTVDSTQTSGKPVLVLGGSGKRAWFPPSIRWMTTGIVAIAVVGLIIVDFGQGGSLDRMRGDITELFTSSTSSIPLPPPPETEIGDHTGDQGRADHAISEPALQLEQPATIPTPVPDIVTTEKPVATLRSAAKPARARTAAPKKATKQPPPLATAFVPRMTVRPAMLDLSPPAFATSAMAQPAPLFPVGIPEPPAPVTTGLFQQSGTFEAARLLIHNDPVYPALARAAHSSGSVDLLFTIGIDGSVRNVRVVNGNNLLASAAVQAVKSWRFQPARRDGVPIEVESNTVVNFKLD